MCQGGDFTRHNGTGGKLLYGEMFRGEQQYQPTLQPTLSATERRPLTDNGEI